MVSSSPVFKGQDNSLYKETSFYSDRFKHGKCVCDLTHRAIIKSHHNRFARSLLFPEILDNSSSCKIK